jgi:hypothetical protein
MGPTGPEIDPVTGSKTKTLEDQASEGGAESGAFDPDLTKIIAVWPDLPVTTRKQILATVEEAREMDD